MEPLADADRDLALASMEEGVLLFRADGSLALANPAAERLLGPATRGVAGLTPASFQAAVRAAGDAPRRFDLEVGYPPRSVRCTISRVGDAGSILVVARDVTEAERLDATRRDFVTNASHELKTPVATIRATAETRATAAPDDPAAVARFAERIEHEALRLSDIVADLLDLSRLEGGSDRDEDVHLDVVLVDEARRLADAAAAAGVALEVDAAAVPAIAGSARDLELLVRNLLDNAVRYSEPGGVVRAETTVDDGAVVLRVADEGVGIPSRDLSRIFERFYRVDRGRSRDTGGTGLGLAIVRHVTENHGGTIAVESEYARGTRFEVRFPSQGGVR
ncbi:MAG: ATP-binding protein [Actinomycetota bacterium]